METDRSFWATGRTGSKRSASSREKAHDVLLFDVDNPKLGSVPGVRELTYATRALSTSHLRLRRRRTSGALSSRVRGYVSDPVHDELFAALRSVAPRSLRRSAGENKLLVGLTAAGRSGIFWG